MTNNLIKETDSLNLENKEKRYNNNNNFESETLPFHKSKEKVVIDLTSESRSPNSIKQEEQPFITSNPLIFNKKFSIESIEKSRPSGYE
jgi:hypothetical protein